jgi:prepilin-type N-terminal cleavage/methylation domain-containing protein
LRAARGGLWSLSDSGGFSLLELLAVMTILGLVSSVILPRIVDAGGRSQEKLRAHHLSTIDNAVERFFLVEGVWPANDLSDIGANPAYFPDGLPTDPVSGNPYRLNATSKRAVVASL